MIDFKSRKGDKPMTDHDREKYGCRSKVPCGCDRPCRTNCESSESVCRYLTIEEDR